MREGKARCMYCTVLIVLLDSKEAIPLKYRSQNLLDSKEVVLPQYLERPHSCELREVHGGILVLETAAVPCAL